MRSSLLSSSSSRPRPVFQCVPSRSSPAFQCVPSRSCLAFLCISSWSHLVFHFIPNLSRPCIQCVPSRSRPCFQFVSNIFWWGTPKNLVSVDPRALFWAISLPVIQVFRMVTAATGVENVKNQVDHAVFQFQGRRRGLIRRTKL